ncbi:MAG: DCC1-like thiol-disulfide oxidoreductase family protein [Bacteroidota bacterium]
MKTLNKHTLIYDEECPLCEAYTSQFIKRGLLDKEGRTAYQTMGFDKYPLIDKELAANKIVLLNTQTGETAYGIDSLLKVLSYRYKFIGTISRFKWVHIFLTLLYQFISYNRKVVAPAAINNKQVCEPSPSITWRVLFIAFNAVVVHVIVTWYFKNFLSQYMHSGIHIPDVVLFVAQIVFQGIVFIALKQTNFYDYAGQLSFTAFLGALLLGLLGVGLVLLSYFGIQIELLATVSYGIVYMFMFYEHWRRVGLYRWSKYLCVSWIIFRLLIYPLVFIY